MKTQKQFKRWSKTREKGKFRFVLLWTLYFIFIGFTVPPIVDYFFNKTSDFAISSIIAGIIIFSFCGILIGRVQWNRNEKEYQDFINQNYT